MHKKTEIDLIQDILNRVAEYLDKLSGQVFDIEGTVSRTISVNGISDDSAIKNLQSLDYLRQSLEDLALLAVTLGDSKIGPLSDDVIEGVKQKLKLKSTRTLLDEVPLCKTRDTDFRCGEFDLF